MRRNDWWRACPRFDPAQELSIVEIKKEDEEEKKKKYALETGFMLELSIFASRGGASSIQSPLIRLFDSFHEEKRQMSDQKTEVRKAYRR